MADRLRNFCHLCDYADVRGWHVELHTSYMHKNQFGAVLYRDLGLIRVVIGENLVADVLIDKLDIDAPAKALLATLKTRKSTH